MGCRILSCMDVVTRTPAPAYTDSDRFTRRPEVGQCESTLTRNAQRASVR